MTNKSTPTALVAIGGNSLIVDQHRPDIPHQWDAVRETCSGLADMVEAGWSVVVTHGNGPQVGFILRRNEVAAHIVHQTPLDLIVADTQGSIGYMLQQALRNELFRRNREQEVVTIVTQVLVDQNDPAFAEPSKPIGAFMTESEAAQFASEGWSVAEDAGRGWRRMIASPQPLQIIEEATIRELLTSGHIVIAGGGGGIPVVQNPAGELRELKGVYAVIDKDRMSALLARLLNVDLFLISTGVDQVAVNFKKPNQRWLSNVDTNTLAAYLQEGHFARGSMEPKVESVLEYVTATGNPAIITSPEKMAAALAGESGTRIVPA